MNSFDPMGPFYAYQEKRPKNVRPIDLACVPPFLRSLLVKDGTVTNALSAFFLEPIVTEQISQRVLSLELDDPWLDSSVGDVIMRRQVKLSGAVSEAVYLYAESVLAVERLPPSMSEGLKAKDSNLGNLLRDNGFETRREGLWFGAYETKTQPTLLENVSEESFISRQYRIVTADAPMMVVTEHFPINVFAS